MITTHITIRADQRKWLRSNDINFSKFIRDELDKEITRRVEEEKKQLEMEVTAR